MRQIVFFGLLGVMLMLSPMGFAQIQGQKDGLFWIDVPESWQWNEDADGATVMNPVGSRGIHIDFKAVDGINDDLAAMELIENAVAAKEYELASRNGKTILKVDRKIGGAFAVQRGFIISTQDGMRQATAIVFFHNRHLFNIYFEAPREFQRVEMEAIVDTIQFGAPKPKEKEVEAVDQANRR
ncbi:MAG: hypothetical protein V1840_03475 [Candidatus Omnitrophota bacterium]